MNDKGYDPDRFARGRRQPCPARARYRVGGGTPEMVMPDYSYIGVQQIAGALGPEDYSYTWVGWDRTAFINPALLRSAGYDEGTIRPGAVLTLGPLRLRVVRNDWPCSYIHVERDGWRAALRAYREIARRPANRFYRRLIVTAAVWGWARYSPAVVPTWRDLRWPWRGRR